MLSLFRSSLISLLLLSNISYILAATPVSTVEIPLNNTEQQQTDPLLSQGLGIVITRLTGNPEIIEQKSMADIINNPNNYLEKYTQQSEPDRLDILFDQSSIESALSKLNIPYWNNPRPSIMTWWADERDGQANLIDDNQTITNSINEAAATQGFTLQFPISDLNTQLLANKTNFTAKTPTEILEASKQYATNAVIINFVEQTDNKYKGIWQLWLVNDSTKPLITGEVEGSSEKEIANKLFLLVNNALAKVFLAKSEATETLNILINNVDYARYVQVNNLMVSFNANIIETKGSTIHYEVKADPAQLKAKLNLLHFYEDKTQQATTETSNKVTTPTLTFTAE